MSREPRIEYEGAVYHVMNRGDRGGRIFRGDLDYEIFIKTMGEVCRRTGWKVHSYALLPNHFHWQIETPEANLVNGMKWFLGVYNQRFNHRHSLHGHVFQGRYKAVLIEANSGGYFETTTASLAWLAERLHMGAPTAVSAYIKRIDQNSGRPTKRLKKLLLNSVLSRY